MSNESWGRWNATFDDVISGRYGDEACTALEDALSAQSDHPIAAVVEMFRASGLFKAAVLDRLGKALDDHRADRAEAEAASWKSHLNPVAEGPYEGKVY